jgi:hypothetical protein
MSARYTIIIPVAQFAEAGAVLARLADVGPASGMQVLVALGSHPARQRNAALSRSTGAIIVFLDNDCAIGPSYWDELERDFAQPEVEVVGGPALLRSEATGPERIFHALLTHPLVVGPVRARYAAQGRFRRSSQTELILCNLAARREVFEKIGHLPVELYPNEENEWLDRAQIAGIGIYYDPDLQIFRPQRETWSAMARMLVRYGIGRTKQLQVSRGHFTAHQLAPLVLLAPVAAVTGGAHGLALFGASWLAVALLVAISLGRGLGIGQRLLAGLVAPFVPLLYALGQLIGWFRGWPGADAEITVVDGSGRAVE